MAAETTYTPIQTYTMANSTTNAVVFSSIPQTYTDLLLVAYNRDTTAAVTPVFFQTINNDGSSLYSYLQLTGDGSASSGRVTATAPWGVTLQTGASATAGVFATTQIHYPSYSNTTTNKMFLAQSAADSNNVGVFRLSAGLYRSTNAISTITVQAAQFFAQSSMFTLYGIKAA